MQSKSFIIILLIIASLIGCRSNKTDVDKKPVFNSKPAKIVKKFLNLVDKKDLKKAFNLWDFSFEIKSKGYSRLSMQEEKKRWLSVREQWIKEQGKPYIEGVSQKDSETWVSVTWDVKSYPWEKPPKPKPNLVILVLRFISQGWKIVGVGFKL